MKKSYKGVVIVIAIIIAIVALIVGIFLYRRYSPGTKKADLNAYFGVSDTEVAICMQDTISEYKGVEEDGHIYIPIELVKQELNSKFYWDSNEMLLIYTTPDKIIKIIEGTKKISINNESSESDYPYCILKENAEGESVPCVAIDFADEYSEFEYEAYKNPNRVVINYQFGVNEQFAKASDDNTAVRKLAGIKSEILKNVKEKEEVKVLDGNTDSNGFIKVMTNDGCIGYTKKDSFGKISEREITTDFKEEEYTHKLYDKKISLGFHQIASVEGNADLDTVLSSGAEINVICPTWFQSSDNNGNIKSFGDYNYVEKAHAAGLDVWGLVDDFSEHNTIGKVLSATTARQKLEKNLVAEAIKYSLDGINIDFEYVQPENGDDFVQFIRELSVLCRKYELVLSIDNYPPGGGTDYYNRHEQALVADYVITMAYDEYNGVSEESGPTSSLTYVKDALSAMDELIPKEQSIIALPFYTRIWATKGKKKPTSTPYGMKNALEWVNVNNVSLNWDDKTSLNYGSYKSSDGIKYEIWCEDKESLELKMKEVSKSDVAGMAYWKLGLEESSVWPLVKKYNR